MGNSVIEVLIQLWPLALGLLISLLILKILGWIIGKALKKTKLDPMLHRFIIRSVQILILAIIIIIALEKMGVQTVSFVAVLSVVGAAIALALKESLGNLAGGFTIITVKPFKHGDYVDIDGTRGVVQQMDLLVTMLTTFNNQDIFIPNGKITNSVVTNFSSQDMRRVDCYLGIGYGDDLEKARQLIYGVFDANPQILKDPEPFIGVNDNGDNSVQLEVRAWCHTPDYWQVYYYLQENIKIAFDEGGVSIPYPQMDIHLKRR